MTLKEQGRGGSPTWKEGAREPRTGSGHSGGPRRCRPRTETVGQPWTWRWPMESPTPLVMCPGLVVAASCSPCLLCGCLPTTPYGTAKATPLERLHTFGTRLTRTRSTSPSSHSSTSDCHSQRLWGDNGGQDPECDGPSLSAGARQSVFGQQGQLVRPVGPDGTAQEARRQDVAVPRCTRPDHLCRTGDSTVCRPSVLSPVHGGRPTSHDNLHPAFCAGSDASWTTPSSVSLTGFVTVLCSVAASCGLGCNRRGHRPAANGIRASVRMRKGFLVPGGASVLMAQASERPDAALLWSDAPGGESSGGGRVHRSRGREHRRYRSGASGSAGMVAPDSYLLGALPAR